MTAETPIDAEQSAAPPQPAKPQGLRRWLALGTGIGIEIHERDLHVMVARVRPSGVAVLGVAEIPNFQERPAAEWGKEYSGFVKKTGGGHLAATVLLPRQDVIVRQLQLPGVANKDLANAVRFQIDTLHPYAEEEALYTWARLGKTSTVLVGITRREVVERYATLFAEAGIKVAAVSFSAAAIYSSLRFYADPPDGFLAVETHDAGVELYGESSARPVLSAMFEGFAASRAVGQALAELRLPPDVEPRTLTGLLPLPERQPQDIDLSRAALLYAAALAAAVPRLGLGVNLLPEAQRSVSSRGIYIPTIVLAVLLIGLVCASLAQTSIDNQRYVALLQTEMQRYEPQSKKLDAIEHAIEISRVRAQTLDGFRRRSRQDMDALNELTRLLAPPAWLNGLDMTRSSSTLSGEAEQASTLLKTLDNSPHFQNSEFTMPVGRANNLEVFRIRAQREGVEP